MSDAEAEAEPEPPQKKIKMADAEEVNFSLKVMINREKSKVLFVEADSDFIDILLTFLTLPLGRIVKLLEKHYGDEAPTIGSLNMLYHSVANLDSVHFCTEAAKLTRLNPTSSFEEYKRLKLDICDYLPAEHFFCTHGCHRFRSVSMYYDQIHWCERCKDYSGMRKDVDRKEPRGSYSRYGVFTSETTSFIISDDLQVLPNVTGLIQIVSVLGITDADKAEPINVTFGFSEIMNLLKASLTSQTPFSDLIFDETTQRNSPTPTVESEPEPEPKPEVSLHEIEKEENPKSKKMLLKVVIQKTTSKLLYAQAEKDFVEFLFCFLNIPLGAVEHLLAGKTCIKTINNLCRSTADLIDDKHFMHPSMKNRLIKLNLPHGYISENHILPLTEECLPDIYGDTISFSSEKFTRGQGNCLEGPRTYHVTDDLTVTPFCIVSILSTLNEQKVLVSDVEELELEIGVEEALGILKSSLTSTSVLTDALCEITYPTNNQS